MKSNSLKSFLSATLGRAAAQRDTRHDERVQLFVEVSGETEIVDTATRSYAGILGKKFLPCKLHHLYLLCNEESN